VKKDKWNLHVTKFPEKALKRKTVVKINPPIITRMDQREDQDIRQVCGKPRLSTDLKTD